MENYFSKKYNVLLNANALFSAAGRHNGASLQHQTYNDIVETPSKFKINYDNLEVLAAVRNPYSRLVSDLWFNKLIQDNATPEQVYEVIKNKFLVATKTFDNHNLPQHVFITGRDGALIPGLKLIKQESLTKDMISLGYSDFKSMPTLPSQKDTLWTFLIQPPFTLSTRGTKRTFYSLDTAPLNRSGHGTGEGPHR